MKTLPVFFACSVLAFPVFAEEDKIFEFTTVDLKTRKTDHFLIKYNGKELEPAKSHAEDVWEECSKVMPKLESDFKSKFRAPGTGHNRRDFLNKEGVFRFRLYMIEDNPTYVDLVIEQLDRRPNQPGRDTQRALLQQVGMFDDFENRFLVQDVNPGRGGAREVQLAHGLASTLLRMEARQSNLPLWLGAGIGYYIEHQLFERCRIYYLDFSAYYKGEAGKINKGEILDGETAWTKPLRKMARAGKTEHLSTILGANVATMTPRVSGYIFGLSAFMLSTEARAKSYQRMIDEIAAGQEPGMAHVLKCFGYDSAAGFERAWYEFLGSAKFR